MYFLNGLLRIFLAGINFPEFAKKNSNAQKFLSLKYTTYEFAHQKGSCHSERLCFPDLYSNIRQFHSKIQNIASGNSHHVCHTKSSGFCHHHPILSCTHYNPLIVIFIFIKTRYKIFCLQVAKDKLFVLKYTESIGPLLHHSL